MKVVVDGIIYELQMTGGISRFFSEILPRMCSMDTSLQITLFTQNESLQPLPVHPQITHDRIPSVEKHLHPRRFWRHYSETLRVQTYKLFSLNHERKIWHSTYFTDPGIWKGPRVVTVHDIILEMYPEQFNFPEDEELRKRKRKTVLKADAIISNSETTKKDLISYFKIQPEKIHVTPLAHSSVFSPVPIEAGNEPLHQKPFLLYIGRRSHYKNFDILLTACTQWNRRDEVDLLVVGPAWSKDEQKRLTETGINEQVILLQMVDDEHLRRLYNQALAFVLPSLYEGFGIPLLEAMACGCPVIASSIPSTHEVAGDCPIYFDPLEVDSLLNALELIYQEGKAPGRVSAGIERANKYSWERTARQTLDVYYLLNRI